MKLRTASPRASCNELSFRKLMQGALRATSAGARKGRESMALGFRV